MKKNKKGIIPNITDDNEQEYWIEYKKTLSPHIKEALVIKYSNLVKYVANQINFNMKATRDIEFDDLVGYGA